VLPQEWLSTWMRCLLLVENEGLAVEVGRDEIIQMRELGARNRSRRGWRQMT
jgi:hypothetical protein